MKLLLIALLTCFVCGSVTTLTPKLWVCQVDILVNDTNWNQVAVIRAGSKKEAIKFFEEYIKTDKELCSGHRKPGTYFIRPLEDVFYPKTTPQIINNN